MNCSCAYCEKARDKQQKARRAIMYLMDTSPTLSESGLADFWESITGLPVYLDPEDAVHKEGWK